MRTLNDLMTEIFEDFTAGNILLATMNFSALVDLKLFIAEKNSRNEKGLKLKKLFIKSHPF